MSEICPFEDRCILNAMSTAADSPGFHRLPGARCNGSLPEEPLTLYSLCLDCDLLHKQGNRELFTRLARRLKESGAGITEGCTPAMFGETGGTFDAEREQPDPVNFQQKIIDSLPDATFVVDSEQRVIAWNRAMAELSGVPAADIMGMGVEAYSYALYGKIRPLLINLVGSGPESARAYYQKVEMHGATLTAEGGIPATLHGTARDLWITASPLLDSDGTVIGAVESIRDITTFKKAEVEREMLKDQLHHAQKLDSIGQLAGGIAHEFNNIMAAILGYAGILEMRLGENSPHLPAVQRIINATGKAASLTRGMLTFSRKQIVALEPVQLNSMLNGMKEMLSRLAGENIRVDISLENRELVVNADMGQLQQIVLNLYNNSRDAMPAGGILRISTAGREVAGTENDLPSGILPGRYVQLTVADTGCGIRPEEMKRIFDPFFTTKEVGRGTGLGLSMVFGIVRRHEGYINVVSKPEEGTAFSVWLPEYGGEGRSRPDEDLFSSAGSPGGRGSILVGEDNEDVRPMIMELLQDVGYQVYEARDGVEVVSIMDDFGDTVDLLLLDVVMPRMNGYEALSTVRKRYPDVPCLFLSGYSDEALKQKALITGKFEYLSKPVMPETLLETVRNALISSGRVKG